MLSRDTAEGEIKFGSKPNDLVLHTAGNGV